MSYLATDTHGNVWSINPSTGVQELYEAFSPEALAAAQADIKAMCDARKAQTIKDLMA